MSKDKLKTIIIGALILALAVIGYLFYQESQEPTGVEIGIDENGISITEQ